MIIELCKKMKIDSGFKVNYVLNKKGMIVWWVLY